MRDDHPSAQAPPRAGRKAKGREGSDAPGPVGGDRGRALWRWVNLGSCALDVGPGPGRPSSAGRGYGSLTYGASKGPPSPPSLGDAPAEPGRPSALCGKPEPLTRQQFPGAVLLLPDLQRADPGGRRLALELGLGQVDVTCDGGIADHRNLELGELERLDALLAGHHAVDELFLGLDPAVGMAVADLRGCDLLQLGLVGFEQRLSKDLDVLLDRRLVGGLGVRETAEQKAGSRESHCACNRQFTSGYVHGFLLLEVTLAALHAPAPPPPGASWR